jgi:hypothetical protein
MSRRFLSLCGILAPLVFIFMAVLGGVLRPGYSHLSDTISELMSPGSPNKLLLDILYTTYSLLLILFGFGLLQLVRKTRPIKLTGMIGAVLFIVMGCLNALAATVFPQDAWGSIPTFAGEMHNLLHGVIGILGVIYMLLFGIWSIQTGSFQGLGIHSFVTIGLLAVSAFFLITTMGGPLMGLVERIAGLIGMQWTFILALRMFLSNENQ